MPTAITNHLPELLELRQREFDASIEGIQLGIEQIGDRLLDALIDLDGDQRWQAQVLTRQITWIRSQLRGQLNRLGWDDLAVKFVEVYDETELFGRNIVQAVGRMDAQLHPLRKDTIQNLRDLDLGAFNEFGNRLITAVSKELTLNTLAGKKRSDMIRDFSKTMDGQTEQAKVYVDTACRVFDRTANGMLWESAGINRYRYFGPRDNVNRPFCASHVGRIYTCEQIKHMNNGSTRFADPWIYGGGPRCRHTWAPVVDAEAQDQYPQPYRGPATPEPQPKGRKSKSTRAVMGKSAKPHSVSVDGLLKSMWQYQQVGQS